MSCLNLFTSWPLPWKSDQSLMLVKKSHKPAIWIHMDWRLPALHGWWVTGKCHWVRLSRIWSLVRASPRRSCWWFSVVILRRAPRATRGQVKTQVPRCAWNGLDGEEKNPRFGKLVRFHGGFFFWGYPTWIKNIGWESMRICFHVWSECPARFCFNLSFQSQTIKRAGVSCSFYFFCDRLRGVAVSLQFQQESSGLR